MAYNSLAALRFRAEASPDKLKVAYAIRNLTGGDLGIFNCIPFVGASGIAIFLPSTVYVDVEGETLHLSKFVLPVPEELKMSARPVPNVSRLNPAAEFVESFALSLPLPAYNPLKRAQIAGSAPSSEIAAVAPVQVTSIRLSIGVFAAPRGLEFVPASPDAPDIFRLWPPGPAIDGQVVLSQTVALASSITVLDYAAIPRHP